MRLAENFATLEVALVAGHHQAFPVPFWVFETCIEYEPDDADPLTIL
jgi:hypothetical protein